ncbi:ADP-ribosylation factor-like protein 3 [Ptychodera flava]|uniref:ADP-ribosylation factor-like protein 3 n=1 Tax=Ptychodera flava TaxID=63121 RepID=UPI00396A90A1
MAATGDAAKVALALGAGAAVVAGVWYYFKERGNAGAASEDEFDGGFEVLNTEESPEKRVLVLGLDGSGKSSLLNGLSKQDNKEETKPTEGFHVIVVQAENVTLNIWEIGGKENVRSYWENFIVGTEVLLFVVDSADTERFDLAKEELGKLLADARLTGVPAIIIANKQDVPGAKGAGEIREILELKNHVSSRDIHVVETQVPLRSAQLGVPTVYDLLTKLTKKS